MRRVVTLGTLAFVFIALVGATTSASPRGAADPAYRGLVHNSDGPCGEQFEVKTELGHTICTHGPDPAPGGIDVSNRKPILNPPRRATGAPTAPISCIGNGVDGPRVQAIYTVATGVTDRYASVVDDIQRWSQAVEGVAQESAAETGGVRGLRWVTTPSGGGCEVDVDHVVMPSNGDDSFQNTINALQQQGYLRSDRRYLVWVDADLLCGIGGTFLEDLSGVDNPNNGVLPLFSRVDNGCWGILDQFPTGPNAQSVEAHELMHNLGAVQASAPHATTDEFGTATGGHCFDEFDVMCYDDDFNPSTFPLQTICPDTHATLYDCNHDDYFHTNPGPGTYLDDHWNPADALFFNETPFPQTQHLDVTIAGAGSGTVVGELFEQEEAANGCQTSGADCSWVNSIGNQGINCPGQCSVDHSTNYLMNLVATPSGGSGFGAFGGDCVQTDTRTENGKTVGVCTVSMGSGTDVEARFGSTAPQPDLEIGVGGGARVGDNIYNSTGANQTKSATAGKGKGKKFTIRLTNDSLGEDSVKIKGTGKSKDFTVKYTSGGQDITSFVVAGTINVNDIPPNSFTTIEVTIRSKSSASKGDKKTVKVTATSLGDSSKLDTVKAKLTVN